MKKVREFFIAMFVFAAIFIGLALLAEYSIYQQDLRLCMEEGSKADCEAKLNGTQAKRP